MEKEFFERIRALPFGFSACATHPNDAVEITELVRQVDIAACGETSSTVEEISGDITSAKVKGAVGSAVITQDEAIVGIVICFDEIAEGRGMFFDVFISPSLPLVESVAITEQILSAVTEYATEISQAAERDEVVLKTALYEADAGFLTGLKNQSFEQHRIFWRMRRNTTTPLSHTSLPDGYTIVDFDNTEANMREIHALQSDVFMDYYDFTPLTFEAWQVAATEGTNDPAMWRVIMFEGKMVGFLMASHRFMAEGFGYVAAIGISRHHRSRGLAKSLLMDLFLIDTKAGRIGTLLHGDSSNPTGAMVLYESVGMKVDRVYVAFKKVVALSTA